ncbi:MAG: urate hydroxylase PuuD [Bdellovibrionales bacterium]|nr:urate hydroxylase PuuD [Bdellovibrionales bacterium]
MNIALFTMDGILFLFRWLHIFFGVTWIGLLYYFNFVQGAFFAETDAATKSGAVQKLVPRALWWFRYAALFTFLTGVCLITGRLHMGFNFATSWGVCILTGMTLGTIMFLNVWLIIWPNQKIVIASATAAATGGKALPEAAAAGAKAGLASRTNTLFSIPMLFFMAASNHLTIVPDENSKFGLCAAIVGAIIAVLTFNGVKGKTGPMTSIKGVIHCGFALAVVLYAVIEITL